MRSFDICFAEVQNRFPQKDNQTYAASLTMKSSTRCSYHIIKQIQRSLERSGPEKLHGLFRDFLTTSLKWVESNYSSSTGIDILLTAYLLDLTKSLSRRYFVVCAAGRYLL